MDVIRRNTDCALRAMTHLARQYGSGAVSARTIACAEKLSYPLAAKILQLLQKAGLVHSAMGVRGGFELARDPTDISLLDVIVAIQGPISLIRCVMGTDTCCEQRHCMIYRKFSRLQSDITRQLREISLAELMAERLRKKEQGEGTLIPR